MIRAQRHAGFTKAFGAYLRFLLRRSFRGIWLRYSDRLPLGGFVAAANHSSWWDGFVPFAVQAALAPHAPFYVMMDRTQLRRFPFFRWGGAFSIDVARARSAHASIGYAGDLARSGAGVWIFPEGRIAPPAAPQPFAGGYLHAALAAGVPIVPVAMRYAVLDAQRPDAFVSIGEPIGARDDARRRVPECLARMLREVDAAIAGGYAFAGREPLFRRAAGVDDLVARVTAPFGKRL